MALVKIARCTDGWHADSKRSSSNGGRVCQTSNSWNPMPTPAKVKALCNEDLWALFCSNSNGLVMLPNFNHSDKYFDQIICVCRLLPTDFPILCIRLRIIFWDLERFDQWPNPFFEAEIGVNKVWRGNENSLCSPQVVTQRRLKSNKLEFPAKLFIRHIAYS